MQSVGEEEMRPHFVACEKDVSVSLLPCPAPPASLKLHEGALRMGWKSLEVPRWFQYRGQSGAGKRQSMTETFVPRFLAAGGQLLPRTRVLRFRSEGEGWEVEGERSDGRRIRISAQSIFVCGGALQTPALLRRSGITDNIGNSLRMHPTVKVTARFPEMVNSSGMGVPVHQVKEFSPRLSFGCSISSPAYLALGLIDHPQAIREVVEKWGQMANYYAMITGTGSGTVRCLGSFLDPLVKYQQQMLYPMGIHNC